MFRGTFTALVTPHERDGNVDEAALAELVERQLVAGIDGLVLFRSTAESSSACLEERRRVLELVQERTEGHVFVIAAAPDGEAAREMDWLGVDAILCAVPDGVSSQRDLVAHVAHVARSVDCPVLLSHRGGCLEPATLAEIAENGILRGLDVSSGDLDFAAAVLAVTDEDFCVMSGEDAATVAMIALGAHGAFSLTANARPEAMKALVDAALAGDTTRARERHDDLFGGPCARR